MNIYELTTPSFLVDLDRLENNINSIQKLCDDNNKQLWPMVKTHKSTEIAKMQLEAGAKGFLVGTLDEAEVLAKNGIRNITYAYPVVGKENLKRVIDIAKMTKLYVSIDCLEQAKELDELLKENDMRINALIIVDSGLNRFGIDPKEAGKFYKELRQYNNIDVVGIGTHPGQVYGSKNMDDVKLAADDEIKAVEDAKKSLLEAGLNPTILATGSTPTIFLAAKDDNITVLRPGNYIFYDNIQMSIGLVEEEDCALSILATVVSSPKDGLLLIDAGSKCFGLDKGAHGNSLMEGYGYVINHPELVVSDLSEEVAKVKVKGSTDLKIGDKIRIIPNHSCSSANFTNYLIGYRDDKIERVIEIDIRGGSIKKPIL